MDERIPGSGYKKGRPVPEWSLAHRLYITGGVGPVMADSRTIYRYNSTFMDVTDQPYLERQYLAFSLCIFLGAALSYSWGLLDILMSSPSIMNLTSEAWGSILLTAFLIIMWTSGGIWIEKREYFTLKRRPIRFNRKEKKIYTIRQRGSGKPGEGDETWEVPWDEQQLFCIERVSVTSGTAYLIRHYEVDGEGNVVRSFAFGRTWRGNLESLLAQWNYWCAFMNDGPAALSRPQLFHKEHETPAESFWLCYYFGNLGPALTLIFLPLTLPMALCRMLSLATCREPVWPAHVEAVSQIEPGDPYDQPSDDTPTGWYETAIAMEDGRYPIEDRKRMAAWQGTQDEEANARRWLEEGSYRPGEKARSTV